LWLTMKWACSNVGLFEDAEASHKCDFKEMGIFKYLGIHKPD